MTPKFNLKMNTEEVKKDCENLGIPSEDLDNVTMRDVIIAYREC